MVKNVCSTPDRVLRIVIGIAFLALWFVLPGAWQYLALIGIVPLVTVVLSYCPISQLFGINTCSLKHTHA